MPNPAKYQTLSELTNRILLRLGFVAQDASNQYDLIHEFIRSAQESLIVDFDDMLLQDLFLTDKFVKGESLYDITPDSDPEQLNEVVYRQGSGDSWCKLKRGIPIEYRDDDTGEPRYYEVRYGTSNTAQIEFYPTPDEEQEWGYSFKRTAARLTQAGDRTSIDSELVFLKSLAFAQRHFGYGEDSLVSDGEAQKRLYKLRVRSNHGYEIKRGVNRHKTETEAPEMRVNIVMP